MDSIGFPIASQASEGALKDWISGRAACVTSLSWRQAHDLPPSPLLNAYIHRHTFGGRQPAIIPAYSSDIAAAFLLIEQMRKRDWSIRIEPYGDGYRASAISINQFGDDELLPNACIAPAEAIVKVSLAAASVRILRHRRGTFDEGDIVQFVQDPDDKLPGFKWMVKGWPLICLGELTDSQFSCGQIAPTKDLAFCGREKEGAAW